MTLGTGAIAFGDINVELGVARTTMRALGSAAARALAGVPSGAIRTAADFRGKSAEVILDTQTVTAGYYYRAPSGKDFGDEYAGYTETGVNSPIGSISDGSSNIYGGARICEAYQQIAIYQNLSLGIEGTLSNSGWSKMRVLHVFSGTVYEFNRVDATFNVGNTPLSGTVSSWSWAGATGAFANYTAGQNTYTVTFIQ